jgi:hypothetical protein
VIADDESMTLDDLDAYETALRRLPEAHSLALRLRSAGVANDVVCRYLHIEPEGLETLIRVAEDKLDAELHRHRTAGPTDRLS